MNKLTRQILAQNSGRDFARLTLKCAALRSDAFAFFRGTNALFLAQLPRAHRLFKGPRTLICGDLHIENFGAFKGDNRLVYFDLNDFDEACLAPVAIDLVRLVASVHVAATVLRLSHAQARKLVTAFLDAYGEAITDGKPRWLERSLAQGVFRTLLRQAARRTRRALLDRLTRLKAGERRIRIGTRALPVTVAELGRLRRFLKRLARTQRQGARFFTLKDAARRVAGNGSLGLPRYVMLIDGRGGPDENFALDLKLAAPSAVAQAWRGRQPPWASEADRVTRIQRILQAIPPAWLHPVPFDGQPYVLKELQPSIDRLQLAQWRGRPKRLVQSLAGMGRVSAWAHLRACGHLGAASAEELQRFVAGTSWRRSLEALGERMAGQTLAAFRTYARDYDRGDVTAALEAARTRAGGVDGLQFKPP